MNIVPLTADHVAALPGDALGYTMTGYAVLDDAGVAGFVGMFMMDRFHVLIARIADRTRPHLCRTPYARAMLRSARMALAAAAVEVQSVADPAIPASANVLTHLGFTHAYGDVWRWTR